MHPKSDLSTPRPESSGHLSVQILGSLRIHRAGIPLDAHQLGGPRPRQILEILLLRLGKPVSKDTIIQLLWGETPPPGAVTTLESYVCVLRRNLQPGRARTGPLRTTTGGYLMDGSEVDLDLDVFNSLIHAADKAPSPREAYPLLCAALELTAEPLLGDELLPEWAEHERNLHRARVMSARIRAAETALSLGRPNEALSWAQESVSEDPLSERAWTTLVLSLEKANRAAEALHAYERCRRTLRRELGCAPGQDLLAAYARLLRNTDGSEGDLSDVFSALVVLSSQLKAGADGPPDFSPWVSAARLSESVQEAARVVDSFLRRALIAS